MGKTTDKLYITNKEWAEEFGGAKQKIHHRFKRLPFNCCSLSLQPAEHPVMTKEGTVFELLNIIPWIKKHQTNPVTGEPLDSSDLIKIHFTKSKGESICPILQKTFNEHSHIVCIRNTGNIFSYEAVETLNIKPKFYKDLLNDEPFTKKDIITIQDPYNLTNRDITSFHYIKNEIPIDLPRSIEKINAQGSTNKILDKLSSFTKSDRITPSFVKPVSASLAAHYTDNSTAMSFTSTTLNVNTQNASLVLSKEDFMVRNLPKNSKAFVQLVTNLGEINLELFCSEAPKTCYNFIKLCQTGYYKQTLFHRNLPGFMIQGGDPTGTGKGGDSFFKGVFEDEFHPTLKHDKRGILSMANRGVNTNTSQFFLTYKDTPHLDKKHTIFGKLVGGEEVLNMMEITTNDSNDKPIEDIIIENTIVYQDCFAQFLSEMDQKEGKKVIDEKQRHERQIKRKIGQMMLEKRDDITVGSIGKYMNTPSATNSNEPVPPPEPIKKPKKTGFGNFDNF